MRKSDTLSLYRGQSLFFCVVFYAEKCKMARMDKQPYSKEHFKIIGEDLVSFAASVVLAFLTGLAVGAYASLFGLLVNWATDFRQSHMWLIFLLPFGGAAIILTYHLCKVKNPRGTNRVLESISSGEPIPLVMAPLITFSTALTHFLGGSAGREGAAIQIGGSLGMWFGRTLRLNPRRVTIMTLCGISAAFSALFGTPLTAAFFAMEVISIGIIHYSAIVPCAVSSLTALMVSKSLGLSGFGFESILFPDFTWQMGVRALILGILCALVGILFCIILHKTENAAKKFVENQYLRAIAGAIIVLLLTIIVGNSDYNGLGTEIIKNAVAGTAVPYAFLLKMLFTAVTLAACFKGGEIVPTIFIGATFGCVFGPLLGIGASQGAALGICGVFCAVTNCPITSIIMSFELFGISGLPMFLLVAAVSYRLSGYYGLYTGQKIIYSKSQPKFVNRTTHE